MTYSQNGEDLIISEYFGEFKGHLLDIGANNGVTFSNSRLLIESGWTGVLVEPSLAYAKLCELYKGHQGIECLDCAISDKEVELTFYETSDSLVASLSKTVWMGKFPYKERTVKTVPYSAIQSQFDFINIDTEGEDWNILQQIDLTNVKCLCIEYGKYQTLITRYCENYNMKLLYRNGENLIFVK